MKKFSKNLWDRLIKSGLKGIAAGACFAIALSASVYFASAHFSRPVSTQNEIKPSQETINNNQDDIQVASEQNSNSSESEPAAAEVKTEKLKISSTSSSSPTCNEELKQQAINFENSIYNAKVEAENARKQKALDDLKTARDQKIAQIGSPSSSPEWTALMKEQQQKLSIPYSQKNSELARLPHDSQGRILDIEKENQINAKYDPLIKAINDEYAEKRKLLTNNYAQTVKGFYEEDQKSAVIIVRDSKEALAKLASDHQVKIDQINSTCY
ncbi:MAG: hypothetical protein BWY19_01145 [bacterium ADurb.Bin212]|nr:MAG: hypothetical protein BWY19_01145 [bacterium ADurb.Bin212]